MIKKILQLIAIYILSFFAICTTVIQVIYINQNEVFGITLNYSYLFFQNDSTLITLIAFISLIPCIAYLINFFIFSYKSKDKNFNKLMSKYQAKRKLLKVSFDNQKIILTPYDKLKIFLSQLTHPINKKIQQFADNHKELYWLRLDSIKLPECQQWSINGKTTYKRAGMPIVVKRNKVWLDPSDSHNLINGTTNSGKTWLIIFNMIEIIRMAGESAIIVDMKGELSQQTYHKFIEDGYDAYCIDFINPSTSDGWNPLELGWKEYKKENKRIKAYEKEMGEKIEKLKKAHILKYGSSIKFNGGTNENGDEIINEDGSLKIYKNQSKAEEYFRDVVNTIFSSSDASQEYWNSAAGDVLLGAILFLCEIEDDQYINLEAAKKLIDIGDMEMSAQKTFLETAITKLRTFEDLSVSFLIGYVQAAENTRKSIKNVFSTKLNEIILNQDVKNMLSNNNIDLEKIGDRKTVVFLKVHDEKSVYYPLVNLFMSQVYASLIENARNNANLRLKVPLNIIWDEFGSSPKFEPIKNLLSAGRSRGIRCTLVVQGYDQLESKYGKEDARTIKNNTMNKVYLLSGDKETLKEFSEAAGKQKKRNEDGKIEEIPIFSVEKLSKFQFGEALFIRQRMNPFYTKLIGYNKYRYYTSKKSEFKLKNHPTAKYLDIRNYINVNLKKNFFFRDFTKQ